jgi:hypothetical protein
MQTVSHVNARLLPATDRLQAAARRVEMSLSF